VTYYVITNKNRNASLKGRREETPATGNAVQIWNDNFTDDTSTVVCHTVKKKKQK
jgi:hypothetical protein